MKRIRGADKDCKIGSALMKRGSSHETEANEGTAFNRMQCRNAQEQLAVCTNIAS